MYRHIISLVQYVKATTYRGKIEFALMLRNLFVFGPLSTLQLHFTMVFFFPLTLFLCRHGT